MPEQTPPAEKPNDADQAPATEKPSKASAKPAAPTPPAERRRARPEDAMVIQALLDLHRTVEERQGATIRGRSPAIGNRYLEAAKALGDELVDAVLGPATKA